jgi:hypothetical protein
MPGVDQIKLYRWSLITNRVGLGAIFVSLAFGFGLDWLSKPFIGVTKVVDQVLKRRSAVQRAAWVAVVALMLSVWISPGPRYVHPEGSRWITTGKAGSWEVPADFARLCLWHLIRMDALFLLGATWILGGFSWALLAGIRQVEASGEELVPRVMTYVRPRDYRG